MNKVMELTKDEDISAYYRGLLIQDTIDLELRMDIVIGRFLSMNNQKRVYDIIEMFDIAEIGFYNKNRILQFIVKKYFISFFKKNNSFFPNIEYIMVKRNILAHRRPEFDMINQKQLSWAKTTKNGVGINYFEITKDFSKEFRNKCADAFISLIELDVEIAEWIKQQNKKDLGL